MMVREELVQQGRDKETSSKKAKVLYLTHRVPHPPNRGDRIRSFHTLRHLAERATVDLACLADEPISDASRKVLHSLCRRVAVAPLGKLGRWTRAAASLASGRSATERLFYSPELFRTLADWSTGTQYDAVLVLCSSMAIYLDAGRLSQLPAFIDLVDVDSQKWFDYAGRALPPLRALFNLEGRRVKRLEESLATRSRAMFVVSEDEARLLGPDKRFQNVYAVRNGVDCEYFQRSSEAEESAEPECVFVGALDYRANIDGITWFCREVWPQVVQDFPTARLNIVGRRPASAVQQLTALPGVNVIADVPDVRPYLRSAQVAIAPLRIARGVQNKVLEALAAGKAIVASSQSLVGLDLHDHQHVRRADTPAQWLTEITQLFRNADLRRQLGAAGSQHVRENYEWDRCLSPLWQHLGLATKTDSCRVPSPLNGVMAL